MVKQYLVAISVRLNANVVFIFRVVGDKGLDQERVQLADNALHIYLTIFICTLR